MLGQRVLCSQLSMQNCVLAGDERIKDKGLSCQYIIARKPEAQPTSDRAIPVSIFSAEPALARSWLRAWCGDVGAGEAYGSS